MVKESMSVPVAGVLISWGLDYVELDLGPVLGKFHWKKTSIRHRMLFISDKQKRRSGPATAATAAVSEGKRGKEKDEI